MSKNILFVPIHLDALVLDQDQNVVAPMADFSRLPYTTPSDPIRDANPNIAYISEEIVNQAFQDTNLPLKTGIHLHWALPDALTQGTHKDGESDYPAVPNRWLLRRTGGNQPEQEWVIESDYLHPEGEGDIATYTPFLMGKNSNPPFRFIGRRESWRNWKDDNVQHEYLPKLTAIGYGHPAFAAFYPNCYSVFGLHDPTYITNNPPEGLQYEIMGWYHQGTQDPFCQFITQYHQDHPDATQQEQLEAIKETFNWHIVLENEQEIPQQTLYYARLTFGTSTSHEARDTAVTVANTGTEALSAHLAHALTTNYHAEKHRKDIEDLLESLHIATQLGNQQLDLGASFNENRHTRTFNAFSAGTLWRIRPINLTQQDDQASNTTDQPTLPDELAHPLNALNLLQQQYDQQVHQIEDLRKQIFADWYKYMICLYPPEGVPYDYPDPDLVQHFIKEKDLPYLVQKQQATGTLLLQRDASGNITAAQATEGDADESLAARLAQAINSLIALLNRYTTQHPSQTIRYLLQQSTASRYWQAKEPVVLITGSAARPTDRHGQDGKLNEDNTLACQVLTADQNIEEIIKNSPMPIVHKIESIAQANDPNFAFSTWTQQPWNPFLLEWEVELFPVQGTGTQAKAHNPYSASFIIANYELRENSPELTPRLNTQTVRGANIYSGSSILTPHATIKLKKELKAYLQRLMEQESYTQDEDINHFIAWYISNNQVIKQFYQDQSIGNTPNETSLLAHLDTFITWAKAQFTSRDQTIQRKTQIKNTYQAVLLMVSYQQVHDLNCLSQALSGFNQALIMHKQTQQLAIDDLINFIDYRPFSQEEVRRAVGQQTKSAPEPLHDFNPFRTGQMQIIRLRLVDTFGQAQEIPLNNLKANYTLTLAKDREQSINLPPRLAQPARLHFRWLSASQGEQEMNSHPASSPICGWILTNHLDNSLALYDQAGNALGTIDQEVTWRPVPGSTHPMGIEEIDNIYLKQLVAYLLNRDKTFISHFISNIDSALQNIAPENFSQHQDLALLMGRPIALVRASLQFQLQGLPALHQSWESFRQDLQYAQTWEDRPTDRFTHVKLPIRIGEYKQLNDGLVGYWKENSQGNYAENIFYAPQSDVKEEHKNALIYPHTYPDHLNLSLEDDPQILTMLVDPLGKVHATTGILPVKAIDIPSDQYTAALQNIQLTLLTTPLLTDSTQVAIPLPKEPGYSWTWLQKQNTQWHTIAEKGIITWEAFDKKFDQASALWSQLIAKKWIQPIPDNTAQAQIIPKDQRTSSHLDEAYQRYEEEINHFLDQFYLTQPETQVHFTPQQVLREGWLKITPTTIDMQPLQPSHHGNGPTHSTNDHPTYQPIIHLPLNNLIDHTTLDTSENHYPVTVHGGVTLVTDDTLGQVMQFNGTDGYLQTTLNQNLSFSQGLTLSVWVYWEESFELLQMSTIIHLYKQGGIKLHEKYPHTLAAITQSSYDLQNIDTQGGYLAYDEQIAYNRWLHLAITINAERQATLYKDGQKVKKGSLFLPDNLVGTLSVGREHNEVFVGDVAAYFHGKMAHLRLYNEVLTQKEIQNIYDQDR